MIKTVRTAVAVLVLLLLAAGYAASQLAYPDRAPEYAAWIDRPWAQRLSLALLFLAVVLCFVPERRESDLS